ncbi:MAG: hypothetical protein IPK33_18505 [Gemmatimonadetes bacterium]|nr:hypothetical protein [Gemmatimonadota bacterium]MBK9410922.1 hypothetical protein [Gemmatimonadota bacterium]
MTVRPFVVKTTSWAANDAVANDLAQALGGSTPVRGHSVRIVLGSPPCHRRELAGLPPMSRSALRRHVAANEDRYFPLTSGGLTLDAHWAATRAGGTAVAYAVDTTWLRSLLRALDSYGVRVESVQPEGVVAGRIDLTPLEDRKKQREREVQRVIYTACATVVASALAVHLATVGVRHNRRTTERSTPAPTVLRASSALMRQAASQALTDTILTEEEGMSRRLAASLGSITNAVPDSARLVRLELTDGRPTRIAMIAQDPGRFLERLRSAGLSTRLRVLDTPTLVQRGEAMWLSVELREDGSR